MRAQNQRPSFCQPIDAKLSSLRRRNPSLVQRPRLAAPSIVAGTWARKGFRLLHVPSQGNRPFCREDSGKPSACEVEWDSECQIRFQLPPDGSEALLDPAHGRHKDGKHPLSKPLPPEAQSNPSPPPGVCGSDARALGAIHSISPDAAALPRAIPPELSPVAFDIVVILLCLPVVAIIFMRGHDCIVCRYRAGFSTSAEILADKS